MIAWMIEPGNVYTAERHYEMLIEERQTEEQRGRPAARQKQTNTERPG